jgi:hypothetical protein
VAIKTGCHKVSKTPGYTKNFWIKKNNIKAKNKYNSNDKDYRP